MTRQGPLHLHVGLHLRKVTVRMEVPQSPLTEVRNTPKGRGVFALQALAKGTPVVVGRPLAESSERTCYSLQMNFDLHVDLDEPGKLINHSCDPSTFPKDNEFGGYTFVARRDIAESEEITFDYDMTEFFSIAVPKCLCGTPECRGKTRGFYHLPESKRLEYGDQVGAYAQRWRPVTKPEHVIDTSTFDRYLSTKHAFVTQEAVELYSIWAQAATRFPDGARILDVNPGPSLFSLWPIAMNASLVVCADTTPERMTPSMHWQATDDANTPFDWTPFVMLAALSSGLVDPKAELLRAQRQHLRDILKFAALDIAHARLSSVTDPLAAATRPGLSEQTTQKQTFDVINVSDGSTIPGSDIPAWIDSVKSLITLLKPGGHLVLALSNSHSQARGDQKKIPELTAGTCLEALQSESLGLELELHAAASKAASSTIVILSRKAS
jgi:SAM-dependent methyltransferase